MTDLLKNAVIWTTVLSFVTSQTVKVIMARDLKALKSYGGMPSSHTALIVGATLSLGLEDGFSSPCFGFAVAVSLILLSDILRVRPKISKEIVHTPLDMIVGGIIGTFWAVVISLL